MKENWAGSGHRKWCRNGMCAILNKEFREGSFSGGDIWAAELIEKVSQVKIWEKRMPGPGT